MAELINKWVSDWQDNCDENGSWLEHELVTGNGMAVLKEKH